MDGLGIIQEEAAAKRRADSIKRANRLPRWVYQIGNPVSDEKELWDTYDRMHGMGNVYVFKQSNHQFILIKDDGYSGQQLSDSSAHFVQLLNAIGVYDKVEPYDLMNDCKLKETVIQVEDIKLKRGKVMECLVCD